MVTAARPSRSATAMAARTICSLTHSRDARSYGAAGRGGARSVRFARAADRVLRYGFGVPVKRAGETSRV